MVVWLGVRDIIVLDREVIKKKGDASANSCSFKIQWVLRGNVILLLITLPGKEGLEKAKRFFLGRNGIHRMTDDALF